MKKSEVVVALLADIERNGDSYVSDRIITALDSRPWIRRELIACIEYAMIVTILMGILT